MLVNDMQTLPDRIIVNEALEHICSDKLFRRSHTNEQLLRFLVNQAYLGNDVKEQVIGLEIFKKDYAPEQNDSKIRVSVYYLRKKLAAYYADAGKDEKIRFEIKKGQYNITFKDNKEIITKAPNEDKYVKVPKKILYAFFAGTLIFIGISIFIHLPKHPGFCWDSFLKTDASNICVVSDHFIARDVSAEVAHYVLTPDLKSEEDLIIHNQENPKEKLLLSHFTLFSKMAPFAIQNLTEWFYSYNNSFKVRLESELRYEDYKENNLLFIGQAKNMVLTKSLFLQNSKKFKFSNPAFVYTGHDGTKKYSAKEEGALFIDYAMVSYIPLNEQHEALFFVSEHDIGVMATVHNFTDSKWLKEFYSEIPSKSRHFNALFEVKGVNRSDAVCKLVELELLD
ncbi:hypothetical protein OAO55_03305 [Bacteroidales bacterium]|nr:hypothetical protein [Bacteroidales bacterium]